MNLIIIGIGAASAELTNFIEHSQNHKKNKFNIKGYLDLNSNKINILKNILSNILIWAVIKIINLKRMKVIF